MNKITRNVFFQFFLTLTLICLFLTSVVFSEKESCDYSSFSSSNSSTPFPLIKGSKVKNIIFCIGDGMGISQVAVSRINAVGLDGKLYMERMPITGIARTHSANNLITDSAAAGTALATGQKTNNGVIAMSPDGKNKYLTILEASKNKGMATGLVATSTITHATPASFASHVGSRKGEDDIAIQLLENKVNVLLGGGKQFFIPQSAQGSKRKDNRDLIAEAKAAGYAFVETSDDLKSAQGPFLLGLFQLDSLKTDPPEPTLAELTDKAIETLSKNKKGFFLMVEGSQIDWACHENKLDNTIKQTILFDEAVGKAIDFALKDKHTLVIVTADHETGGLTIKGGDLNSKSLDVNWSTKGHSGTPVPLYAFGPNAKEFAGVYDNTDIPKTMARLLKIKSFPQTLE